MATALVPPHHKQHTRRTVQQKANIFEQAADAATRYEGAMWGDPAAGDGLGDVLRLLQALTPRLLPRPGLRERRPGGQRRKQLRSGACAALGGSLALLYSRRYRAILALLKR